MGTGVVVVAFRDPESLGRCLSSLPDVPVVVANVTADSAVAQIAKEHGAVVVDLAKNVGYAAAVNAAVPALPNTVEHVLFLNDDVTVAALPGEIDAESCAVRAPLHQRDAGWMPELHPLPTPGRFLATWVLGVRRSTAPERPFAANGSALLVRRDVLVSNPLPAEYFLYWEETAWCWRLHDSGIEVVVDPLFRIVRPPGDREFSALKARLLGENLVRLATERYGRAGGTGYVLLGLAWVARLSLTDLIRRDRAVRLRSRWQTLLGVVRAPRMVGASRTQGDGKTVRCD